jgi:hypothetical protein
MGIPVYRAGGADCKNTPTITSIVLIWLSPLDNLNASKLGVDMVRYEKLIILLDHADT